ncbi:hypothetical protein PIB30_116923 [Stylosanthes scabra]|uniref:Uncharacterized protein n=1 Tax=Stylosanthes scabra TaxID=79078 RepID=A0ABU6SBW5_9FABA|nr:hypothetical protein [Stylosanthes scabra]
MRLGNHFLTSPMNYLDVWRSMQELDYEFELSSENKESSTSWTVDAIRRVHSKRPMSRMEVPSHTSSKDEHRDHEDGITSSSSMISFELSNGHPSGPHVPATLNDDADFVEYELEDLTGFPSSAEEEERMLKEAVMVSLEDLEVTHPQNNDSHASSHATSKTISTASDDAYKPSKAESNSISVVRPHSLASQLMITASSVSASGTEFGNSASSCSVCSDSSASLQSSSETDISHNTKATLTVIRNPTANVLNGLIRRWDLNLFRNNRNP